MISRETFAILASIFICASVFLSLSYCSDVPNESGNSPSLPSTSIPHYDLPTEPINTVGDVTDYVKEVQQIHLSPQVAERIGVIFDFTVVDNTDLILVDDRAGSIVRLNGAGEIVWQALAKNDDYRYFTKIEECTFDVFNRRIVLHKIDKSFFFDFDGNPIEVKPKTGFDYHQMFYASGKDQLFSAQGHRNDQMISASKQLFWFKDSTFHKVMINSVPYGPEYNFVAGLPEFTRLNDQIYYHATFRDTFYKVDLPHVLPAFTLDAPTRPTIDEVMRDGSIGRKIQFMINNGMPIPYSVVADENNIFLSSKSDKGNYFSILDRKTENWIVSSDVIKYQNTYLSAPLLYHENYFLREMADYRVAHFTKLSEGMDPSDPEWKAELARLDETYDERGGKTIFLLKL